MPYLKVSFLPHHFAVEHLHCDRILKPVELLKYGSPQDTLGLMAGWDRPAEEPAAIAAAAMATAEVIHFCQHLTAPFRAAFRVEEPKRPRLSDALIAATMQLIGRACSAPGAAISDPECLALAARITHLSLAIKATEASGFVAFAEVGLAAYHLPEALPWRAKLVEFVDDRLQSLLESI